MEEARRTKKLLLLLLLGAPLGPGPPSLFLSRLLPGPWGTGDHMKTLKGLKGKRPTKNVTEPEEAQYLPKQLPS